MQPSLPWARIQTRSRAPISYPIQTSGTAYTLSCVTPIVYTVTSSADVATSRTGELHKRNGELQTSRRAGCGRGCEPEQHQSCHHQILVYDGDEDHRGEWNVPGAELHNDPRPNQRSGATLTNLLTVAGSTGSPGSVFAASGNLSTGVSYNNLNITGGASSTTGGGISFINTTGTLNISQCAIYGNSAAGGGGGIASQGSLTMTGSSIYNNTTSAAGYGGGLYMLLTVSNLAQTISYTTFSGNSSGYIGGGIYNAAEALPPTE